jgi:hypothetical protein
MDAKRLDIGIGISFQRYEISFKVLEKRPRMAVGATEGEARTSDTENVSSY